MSRDATVSPSSGPRLSDRVAQDLLGQIRNGRIVPGDKLPTEAALASRFGVSRTVVREAVSRLKSVGLVDSRQGSGVFVRQARPAALDFEADWAASRQAVIQMVEVRRALEAEVAALAAARRGPADVARLNQALSDIDAAVAEGRSGVDEDLVFHRAIGEAAGNPFLMRTLDDLRQLLRGAIQVTRANEARRRDFARQVRQEHLAIVRAIESADPHRARQAAARHMNNAIRRIEQADPAFWQQEGVQLASPLMAERPPVPASPEPAPEAAGPARAARRGPPPRPRPTVGP